MTEIVTPSKSNLKPTVGKQADSAKNSTTTVVDKTSSQPVLKADTTLTYPIRKLDTWHYDIDLFYIRPDNTKIDISKFVKDLTYSMDYDRYVAPIFTAIILGNDYFIEDLKYHLDNLKFFITLKKFKRVSPTTNNSTSTKDKPYIKSEIVFKDRELLPVNPTVLDLTVQEGHKDYKNIPRRRVKIDFIGKRENEMNHIVQSKIYKDVTVYDVISSLLSEAEKIEIENDKGSSQEKFRVVISPPDNTKKYEQIVLTPGSLSDTLTQLQQDYGIYKTGVRVYLSSADVKDGKHEKLITVTDKGGISPVDGAITKALFEIIEVTNSNLPESTIGGSLILNDTLICRTFNPYVIERNNAKKLTLGESVRVVGSSQDRHSYSLCDVRDGFLKQKTYWNNNDNPYMLTEIQDFIKQSDATIVLKMDNIDVMMFSNNLEYTLKFYNKDDIAYSGLYRLTNVHFQFTFLGMSDKDNIAISALFRFTNSPKLSVEGVTQEKQSYDDKLTNYNNTDSELKKVSLADNTPTNIKNIPIKEVPQEPAVGLKGPFKVAYPGQEDNNGVVIPPTIGYDYKMSDHVVFGNIYDTLISDDSRLKKAFSLCNNYKLFMAAQILSKRILDPLISRFGKFKSSQGKLNSCYRMANGSSSHNVALAADMTFTGNGNVLAEAFFWVVSNRDILGFDQVILESSNGNAWGWLHVGIKINGTNRKQCMYTKTAKKGSYKVINPNKFTSPSQAHFANISSIQ